MAVPVRSGGAERWQRRASAATSDFEAGVMNPRRPWKEATENASDQWEAGVREALQRKAFKKGVNQTSNDTWSERTATLGSQRYAPGVQASQSRYQERVQPFLETISNLNLPPRGAKGDPRNLDRVKAVSMALRKKKESMR